MLKNNFNIQRKIDNLSKKYKNKKTVLYKAGELTDYIFKNFDTSKLNIIAIADEKFLKENIKNYFNIKTLTLNELKYIDYDVILISDFDYEASVKYLDERILYGSKNANIEIRPFISLNFSEIFLH